MESIKLQNLLEKHSQKKNAIIHSTHQGIIEELTFETVFGISIKLKQFLLDNIPPSSEVSRDSEGNICFGLLMEKNIFIPSIIICFQDLNYSFVFLTTKTLEDTIKAVNIAWLLSIDNEVSANHFHLKNKLKISGEKNIELWKNDSTNHNYLPKDIFCIMQTSGSTEENKIVYVPYNCIEKNVISLNKFFNVSSDDTIYWGTPLTFDPTLVELLLGIMYGAALLIVPKSTALNPVVLYEILFRVNLVTFLQVVPSIFLRWAKQQVSDILLNSSLKILAFGGEPFPQEILSYKRNPELKLFNLYGVTELSCWATIADLSSHSYQSEVPLGISLDGTFIEIKHKEEDVFGEICIGSQTRQCFLNATKNKNLPCIVETGDLGEWKNGDLFYRGRKTRVIKRFGHKVALHKLEEIIFDRMGLLSRLIFNATHKKLLAFVKIEKHYNEQGKLRLIDKLRVKLIHTLPEYSIPDFLDVLAEFPLNNHGKISDKCLVKIYENKIDSLYKAKSNSEIFLDTLTNFLKIPLSKNLQFKFTELGGNSLTLMQFLQTFKEQIHGDIPGELVTLLLNDSIKKCLNFIEQTMSVKRKLSSPIRDNRETKILKIIDGEPEDCVLWKFNLKGCVDSAPLAFKRGNNIFVASGSYAQIFSIISESGTEYLTLNMPSEIEAQPCVSSCGNFIFIGCADGFMYAIDLIQKNIFWKYQTLGRIRSGAYFCGNSIIFGSYDEYLYCLEKESGALNWKTKLLGSIRADPIVNVNSIFVGTIKGMCYGLNRKNGSVTWTYKIEGPVFGSPCLLLEDCTVWGSVTGKLYCFTAKGVPKWTLDIEGHIFSSLICHTNVIYFGCDDSYIYKVTPDCEISKFAKLESAISSSPFVYEYEQKIFIVCTCNSGVLYVIEDCTGTVIFRMQLPSESYSLPYVLENQIYVGCRDDNLYCINIDRVLIKYENS
ncbi:unnamed protein product [Ceutorhynchus assimilis]|uniref:Acyl-CoA synthetase family member 4 n=1 Tax=Ceutorhynchus assimilis TaxID=467358 RepID=A0A9N9MGD6_9CUCU|nr:unnamed protein product [Ceutorhynchus assimilis]